MSGKLLAFVIISFDRQQHLARLALMQPPPVHYPCRTASGSADLSTSGSAAPGPQPAPAPASSDSNLPRRSPIPGSSTTLAAWHTALHGSYAARTARPSPRALPGAFVAGTPGAATSQGPAPSSCGAFAWEGKSESESESRPAETESESELGHAGPSEAESESEPASVTKTERSAPKVQQQGSKTMTQLGKCCLPEWHRMVETRGLILKCIFRSRHCHRPSAINKTRPAKRVFASPSAALASWQCQCWSSLWGD